MQQLCHPGAFFGQETAVFLVAAPVLQVNLLVRDVDVAAQDELPCTLGGHEVRVEGVQKAELGLLALFARRSAREVGADDGQLARGCVKAQFDGAALGIELGRAVAGDDVAGLMARVDAHTRVAFFLGKVEMPLHSGKLLESRGDIGRLGLHFLHANTIRPRGFDPAFNALGGGRSDAVEIEAG